MFLEHIRAAQSATSKTIFDSVLSATCHVATCTMKNLTDWTASDVTEWRKTSPALVKYEGMDLEVRMIFTKWLFVIITARCHMIHTEYCDYCRE